MWIQHIAVKKVLTRCNHLEEILYAKFSRSADFDTNYAFGIPFSKTSLEPYWLSVGSLGF